MNATNEPNFDFRAWFYLLVLILVLILLSSCDVLKQSTKIKEDSDLSEQILTKTVRIGDTVRYEVPKVILRDTTIYTYNKQGSTLITRYDEQGAISQIECLTSNIDLLIQENRRLTESVKDKTKEKEENFDSSVIIYGFLGIGVLLLIGGGLFIYVISKQLKPFTAAIEKLNE